MKDGLRKFALVAHVAVSVGWLGSVSVFLVFAVVGLTSEDAGLVRASYLSSDLVTRYMIVPLCAGALITGLVQSLGTHWGLVRHYWVIAKLALTIVGTALLLLHTRPIQYLAGVAAESTLGAGDHRQLRIQLVADASAAIILLLVTTGLSVYKPQGLTPYGWRKQREERAEVQGTL